MKTLIPTRFLFDFEISLTYRKKSPALDGSLADWTDELLLPSLSTLEGDENFAPVWTCWNETGISIATEVTGKTRKLKCNPKSFWTSDHLRLCTDMRDARTNKRATRFCQQFYLLPTGGGKKGDQPVAGVNPFKRAREKAPPISVDRIAIESEIRSDGYFLQAHIPGECLCGFDPGEHARIGLYYILEDQDVGQQYLTIGDDLNWYIDPSTWATAVLAK